MTSLSDMKKNTINDIGGMIYVNGIYLIRQKIANTMVIGITENLPFSNENSEDEIWLGDMMMSEPRRFRVPKRYAGYRADQFLCSGLSLAECEEIK